VADEKKDNNPFELLERSRAQWEEIPKTRIDLYGDVYAPESLNQLTLLFGRIAMLDIGAWRGQADFTWKLDPSLVRRWRDFRSYMGPAYPLDEARLRQHEKDVIEQVREAGFIEPKSELELLAKLQHHGGATRLLDCTRNVMVALWFASQGPLNWNGMLIGFRLGETAAVKLDTSQLEQNIDELLQEADGRLLWWQPRQSNPRIAAQQALFVFSEYVDREWGSVNLSGEPELTGIGDVPGLVAILISSSLKTELDYLWEPLFGFSESTLFPDFDGFAASQGVGKSFRSGAPL
jgi:hypothetical protein